LWACGEEFFEDTVANLEVASNLHTPSLYAMESTSHLFNQVVRPTLGTERVVALLRKNIGFRQLTEADETVSSIVAW